MYIFYIARANCNARCRICLEGFWIEYLYSILYLYSTIYRLIYVYSASSTRPTPFHRSKKPYSRKRGKLSLSDDAAPPHITWRFAHMFLLMLKRTCTFGPSERHCEAHSYVCMCAWTFIYMNEYIYMCVCLRQGGLFEAAASGNSTRDYCVLRCCLLGWYFICSTCRHTHTLLQNCI